MKVLRQVGNIQLNEGNLAAKGLFNISTDNDVSFWFDAEEKDELLALSDEQFKSSITELLTLSNV